MRINRLALGFIGGPMAIVVGLTLAYLEVRLFGILHWKLIIVLGAAAGGSVFWLADRLGLLEEPPAQKSFLASDDDAELRGTAQDSQPIVPK